MDNRRRHPRHALSVDVKIAHPQFGEKIVKTKNVSESGLFILVEPSDMPLIGEIVQGQVLDGIFTLRQQTYDFQAIGIG